MVNGRGALVTGSTRGIGAEICIKLKALGYRAVANYASNEASARNFSTVTGTVNAIAPGYVDTGWCARCRPT